ncbi:uncharacterized protein [Periplaneta americana]|uniref:uncharacterized protein n=1 Tax=Periplaneta americana TaxID=6978 RepID=UPI0037E8F4C6
MLLSLRNAWGAALLILVAVEVAAAYNRGSVLGYQRYRRRHISNVPCHNVIANDDDNFSDFESKIRETEVVFTGKVTELIATTVVRSPLKKDRESQEEPTKFWVRVKRVLKGELPASVDEKQMTVKIRAMEKPKNQQQCYKRPIRVHHTAIFLARKTEDESGNIMLQLRSEPLPLTLRNLDKVNAAVKGSEHTEPVIHQSAGNSLLGLDSECAYTTPVYVHKSL